MDNIISISDSAANQIKDLLLKGPTNVNGIIVGVDKTGCSGYAYKLEYAKEENSSNLDLIETKGIKVMDASQDHDHHWGRASSRF